MASRLRRRGEHGSDDDGDHDDDDEDDGDDDDDGQVQPGRLVSAAQMRLAHIPSTASGAHSH